jgi:hypothetical protein
VEAQTRCNIVKCNLHNRRRRNYDLENFKGGKKCVSSRPCQPGYDSWTALSRDSIQSFFKNAHLEYFSDQCETPGMLVLFEDVALILLNLILQGHRIYEWSRERQYDLALFLFVKIWNKEYKLISKILEKKPYPADDSDYEDLGSPGSVIPEVADSVTSLGTTSKAAPNTPSIESKAPALVLREPDDGPVRLVANPRVEGSSSSARLQPKEPRPPSPLPAANTRDYRKKPRMATCWYVLKGEKCKKQQHCPYSHEPIESEDSQSKWSSASWQDWNQESSWHKMD